MGRERTGWPATLGLCGGYFLVLLDVTVVNVALPRIGTALHAGTVGLAWVVDAYAVPLAALLLASGAIGDRLGHRRVIVAGFAGFGGASVLCALAPGLSVLAAGRALQGGFAALMLPGTLALLTEAAPTEHARTRIVGMWAAVGGAALPAGPVLGGLLTEAAGWRSVFWLNVPVIAAALVPVVRLPPRADRRTPEGTVDWPGAAVLVMMLACAVTAVLQAGTRPVLSVAAAASAVLACGVLIRAERTASRPLLRVPPPARRPLAAACAVAGLMNLCVLGSLFLLTQVLQDVHRLTAVSAGLLVLPGMLPLPLLGTTAGRLTGRLGPWRASTVDLTAAAVGFAGVAASISSPVYPALLCSLAVWGAGIGILTPAIVTAALRALPEAAGTASGASNTARQVGGALGVAAFGAFAGTASAGGFTNHAAWLMAGSAIAFTAAAVFCLGFARRPGQDVG